jgi:hypothetical protein
MASFNTTTSIITKTMTDIDRLKQIITPDKESFEKGEGKKEIQRVTEVFSDLPFVLK